MLAAACPCSHCPQARLGEEYERCAQYLDPLTRKPLVGVVEAKLVAMHLPALLERGFAQVCTHVSSWVHEPAH
jgi:hypothetical protein